MHIQFIMICIIIWWIYTYFIFASKFLLYQLYINEIKTNQMPINNIITTFGCFITIILSIILTYYQFMKYYQILFLPEIGNSR